MRVKSKMNAFMSRFLLDLLQQKRNHILVLRHGHRDEINEGSYGEKVALTPEGQRVAQRMGKSLSAARFAEIHTSPVLRCVQTAQAWIQGAKQNINIRPSNILGDPGPFVSNPFQAGPLFLQNPLELLAQLIVEGKADLPGMRSLKEGALLFIEYALTVKRFPCLMITHDIVICLLCCYFFESRDVRRYLPGFLEGFLMDCDSNKISILYGNERKNLSLY